MPPTFIIFGLRLRLPNIKATNRAPKATVQAVELGKRVLVSFRPRRLEMQAAGGTYNEVHHCYDFGVADGHRRPDARKPKTRNGGILQTRADTHMDACTFDKGPRRYFLAARSPMNRLIVRGRHSRLRTICRGAVDTATEWMKGLAKSAGQGPYAQANFVEDFYGPESNGGAIKTPSDQPYINDWACVSGCNYLEPIVDSLFGVNAGLFGNITAKPQFGKFDPNAKLVNLNYQGTPHIADKNGVRKA